MASHRVLNIALCKRRYFHQFHQISLQHIIQWAETYFSWVSKPPWEGLLSFIYAIPELRDRIFYSFFLCRSGSMTLHDLLDPFHKYQNASVSYLTVQNFVTEMCTSVHISVTKWCIVGYVSDVLWDSGDRSIVQQLFHKKINKTWGWMSGVLVHGFPVAAWHLGQESWV